MRVEIVQLTDHLSTKLLNASYNRKLATERLNSIINATKDGIIMPPIAACRNDGKLEVIDGQHRLAAWRKEKFPLSVEIIDATREDAIKNFIARNSEGIRVSLGHRLAHDPGQMASWVRKMSIKYKARYSRFTNTLMGITSPTGGTAFAKTNPMKDDYVLAERVIDLWASDKRWEDRAFCYSHPVILRALGALAVRRTETRGSVEKVLKLLQGMEFSKGDKLDRNCAYGTGSQKIIMQMFMDYLLSKMA